MLKVIDSMRSKYYMGVLRRSINSFSSYLQKHKDLLPLKNGSKVIEKISAFLADELDQLVLPVISDEIKQAKILGTMTGNSPQERYTSFFENKKGRHTESAKKIVEKYVFLFELTKKFTDTTMGNLQNCLTRFINDRPFIESQLMIDCSGKVQDISILNSDRHNGGQQAITIRFENGAHIVYKPTNLNPDSLITQLVDLLEFPPPYDLKTYRTLSHNGYGWIEFIQQEPCQSTEETKQFWKRAGVALATADAMHLADAHSSNLIAHRAYPVIIDNETYFYPFSTNRERTIFSTGLIERNLDHLSIDGKQKAVFTSGFQSIGKYSFKLFIYPKNERTDLLETQYEGLVSNNPMHIPILNDKIQLLHKFQSEFIDGFQFGYNRITEKCPDFFEKTIWWEKLSQTRGRVILRPTKNYIFLLYEILQPTVCVNKETAEKKLQELISADPIHVCNATEYEIQSLLNYDIPYFYHICGEKHLYNGDGKCYPNVFVQSSVEYLKKRLRERNLQKRDESIKLLKEAFQYSPFNKG